METFTPQEKAPQPATAVNQIPAPTQQPVAGQSHYSSTSSVAPNFALNTRAEQSIRATLQPRPKVLAPEAVAFQRLEERDGVVLDVDEEAGVFQARLVDPSGREPDQEVEIEIDQVSPWQTRFVVSGALFYWTIGYQTRGTGRTLILAVDFRRLPKATPAATVQARSFAHEYVESMGWT